MMVHLVIRITGVWFTESGQLVTVTLVTPQSYSVSIFEYDIV